MSEGFRLRICFQKVGRLRFLSHLEVVRACERAVRRAGLPYAVSQGFTPRMRVSFGPALPVGTAGEREYLDLMLVRFLPAEEVLSILCRAASEDLAPRACGYVPPREASLAAALTIATYDVRLERRIPQDRVECAFRGLLEAGTLSVDHKGKTKVFDLTQAVPKDPGLRVDAAGTVIEIATRIGEKGSLRPEAFVSAALGTDAVGPVTRTGLLIETTEGWRAPL